MPDEQAPWLDYQQPNQPAKQQEDAPWLDYQKPKKPPQPSGLLKTAMSVATAAPRLVEMGKGMLKEAVRQEEGLENVLSGGLTRTLTPKKYQEEEKKRLQLNNSDQQAGAFATNVGELFVPGPGEIQVGKGAALGTKMVAKAISGAVDQGVRSLVQSGGNAKEAAGGAALGGALGAAIPVFGKVLEAAANSQYGKVLHPQGRIAKEVAGAKLLPEKGKGVKGVGSLLDQGMTAVGTSKAALEKKFADEVTKASAEMNRVYASLGPKAQVALKPVVADIAKYIKDNAILPNGTISDTKLYKAGIEWTKKLLNDTNADAFKDAPVEDVRAFRQIIQDQLFKAKLKINPETAEDTIKEQMRASIQKQIHSQHPSTEQVDAIVHFWITAKKLMGAASADQFGSEIYRHSNALFHATRIGVGGLVGEELGRRKGGTQGAILGGIAGAAITEAWASTAWRTTSAVAKNKVANAIVDGKLVEAANIARRALGWSILRDTKDLSKTPTVSQPPTAPPPQKKPTSTYSGDDPNGLFRGDDPNGLFR